MIYLLCPPKSAMLSYKNCHWYIVQSFYFENLPQVICFQVKFYVKLNQNIFLNVQLMLVFSDVAAEIKSL
jgi:hypothetical protein